MHRIWTALLAGLCACSIQAAESPRPPEGDNGITLLLGQWKFLNSSVALCREKVPALKSELDDARDHAEKEIRKAQAIILEAINDDREGYKHYVDLYVQMWSKQADDMMDVIKSQDPTKGCPALLGNWQAIETEVMLEDWGNFLGRYMSEPGEAPAEKGKEKL